MSPALRPAVCLGIAAITAITAIAALPAAPSIASPETDVQEISRLEEAWNQAHLKGDIESLEGLWADDFSLIVPEMPPISREAAVKMWRSMHVQFTRYETSDTHIRLYGDAAVVTGRLHRTRDFGGRVADETWQFTKVYVRQAEHWKVVAFHASNPPRP